MYPNQNVVISSPSIRQKNSKRSELVAFSYISVVLIFFAYAFFSIWFMIDLNNTRNGSIALWQYIFLYHGVIGGLNLIFYITYYDVIKHHDIGSPERAMFNYPIYVWEMWSWFSFNIICFAITLTLSIIYVSKVGLDFVPVYNSPDIVIRMQSLAFSILNFIICLVSVLGVIQTFPIFYVYIMKIYKLKRADEIQSSINKSYLIRLNPGGAIHHHNIKD